MPNTTLHHDAGDQADLQPKAELAAAPTPPSRGLAPLSAATRLAAWALAVLTTSLVLGSQIGLTAMYAAQADAVLAKAKQTTPGSQLVAKAK